MNKIKTSNNKINPLLLIIPVLFIVLSGLFMTKLIYNYAEEPHDEQQAIVYDKQTQLIEVSELKQLTNYHENISICAELIEFSEALNTIHFSLKDHTDELDAIAYQNLSVEEGKSYIFEGYLEYKDHRQIFVIESIIPY
jgi:hypothetical protein